MPNEGTRYIFFNPFWIAEMPLLADQIDVNADRDATNEEDCPFRLVMIFDIRFCISGISGRYSNSRFRKSADVNHGMTETAAITTISIGCFPEGFVITSAES